MGTWLEVLQAEVAASSLAQVAEKLGLSRTTISQVCNEKYPGDMARVQTLVEGGPDGQQGEVSHSGGISRLTSALPINAVAPVMWVAARWISSSGRLAAQVVPIAS